MHITLLFFFIVISFLIVRVGAVALELTGLERNKALFQALSAFTGTGFTTRESEMIVSHHRRRRIVSILMVLGNAGIVSVIATFVLSMVSSGGVWRPSLKLVGIALFVLAFFWLVTRERIIGALTDKIRQKLASHMDLERIAVEEILHQAHGYGIAIVGVSKLSKLAGITLARSGLREQGITVLSIERDGMPIAIPSAQEEIHANDRLVCYGLLKSIQGLVSAG
ncbi:potassium transporter TrkA [bacterium]|nr:potassium transporter TrkA [bacterium]